MRETTALGAAIAAGLAVGVYTSLHELKRINQEGRTLFKPEKGAKERARMFDLWKKAVEMCRGWLDVEENVEADIDAEAEGKKGGE